MKTRTILVGIGVIALSMFGSVVVNSLSTASADWFGDPNKKAPKEDVWQDSCMPVLIHDHMTCQQANYIIKQNARMIELLGGNKQ